MLKCGSCVRSLVVVIVAVCTLSFSVGTEPPRPPQGQGQSQGQGHGLPPFASPSLSSAVAAAAAGNKRVPKQVGTSVGGSEDKDHQPSETGYGHHGFGHGHGLGLGHGGAGHGDSKYFQYAHNPAYDEYEFGYRRGNDHHFQERYERGGPYWNFKTKVKWGDKYAGYGEHYWDYNHGDKSSGGGGGGGGDEGGHGHGHYSEPVPMYESKPGDKKLSMIAKRQSERKSKNKKEEVKGDEGESAQIPAPSASMQFPLADWPKSPFPPSSKSIMRNSGSSSPTPASTDNGGFGGPSLSLDTQTGQVIDESTGKAYWLKPAN